MVPNEHTNQVKLVGYYGSDEIIAQAAWTSTNRTLDADKLSRVPTLLKFLVEGSDGKSHETPFERSLLHFVVTTDQATAVHLLKHRIGVSLNSESARYKELKDDKYYLPIDWPEEERAQLESFCKDAYDKYHAVYDRLVNVHGFDKKRAKESARYYVPYANQLTQDMNFNFRSFVHFCKLRAVPGAQYEVRQVAQKMIRLVSSIEGDPFHHSIRAWNLHKYDDGFNDE